jgi:hypothetical protein
MKTTAMLLIALVMAASGVALARYAEADDAPGGVVIGWVLIAGAVALGVRAFQRRSPKPEAGKKWPLNP